jgi:hypothetical protein
MRIAQVFVWQDERPDDHDEIRSVEIPHRVSHDGVLFHLRYWDIRFPQGEERITDAFYVEVSS